MRIYSTAVFKFLFSFFPPISFDSLLDQRQPFLRTDDTKIPVPSSGHCARGHSCFPRAAVLCWLVHKPRVMAIAARSKTSSLTLLRTGKDAENLTFTLSAPNHILGRCGRVGLNTLKGSRVTISRFVRHEHQNNPECGLWHIAGYSGEKYQRTNKVKNNNKKKSANIW